MVLEIYLYKKQLAGSDTSIESKIGEKNEFSCTIFVLGQKAPFQSPRTEIWEFRGYTRSGKIQAGFIEKQTEGHTYFWLQYNEASVSK